jgi:hypothetical protein
LLELLIIMESHQWNLATLGSSPRPWPGIRISEYSDHRILYLWSDGFFENRDQLLKNILVTKDAHCRFFVTTNCPHIFETESKPSTEDVGSAKENLIDRTFGILLPYCKQHGLPIEFKYSPTTDEQGA